MQTKPLTIEQQNWLKANTYLPVIVVFVMLAVIATMIVCLFVGFAGNMVFGIFIAIASLLVLAVIIATGMHVYNNLMDLRDGVAQVRAAKVTRKHETSRAPKTFYAEFEDAGSIIVMGDVYERIIPGQTYRVTYSPRTRRGWDVEPLS